MENPIVLFALVVFSVLTAIHISLLLRKRSEIKRMNKMANLLYKEYSKIYGKEWAEAAFKDMIKKIVHKVDDGTTVIGRAAV